LDVSPRMAAVAVVAFYAVAAADTVLVTNAAGAQLSIGRRTVGKVDKKPRTIRPVARSRSFGIIVRSIPDLAVIDGVGVCSPSAGLLDVCLGKFSPRRAAPPLARVDIDANDQLLVQVPKEKSDPEPNQSGPSISVRNDLRRLLGNEEPLVDTRRRLT
jgi:hypothetical protein